MIKIINKSDNKIALTSDMNISMANALRRSVNYIPVLAIDSVEISKNDSALYDEIIAHRLGLVPLKNEDLRLAKDCDCGKEDGCGKCSIKLKLAMTGPATVYSSDLGPKGSVIYKMPITILNKDQGIELVATAKVGQGIEHAKFIPGLFYYKYSSDKDNMTDEEFNEMVEETKKENKEVSITIESWGQMKAKDIFIGSVEALQSELKSLMKEIK